MKAFARKLTHAVAIAGLLCGLAATPALADRDHHRRHWKQDRWSERHDRHHGKHHRRHYDRDYYYYEPRVEYYSSPRLYVPIPPPPSFGLNLVFPIH